MIRRFDGLLLANVERFSHFMQRTFGTKAIDLERASVILAIAFELAYMYQLEVPKSLFTRFALTLAHVAIVASLICRLYLTHVYRDLPELRERLGVANHAKLIGSDMRVARVGMVALMAVISYLWGFCWAFQALADYFDACDNLPPGQSRVRKWLASLRASLAPALEAR
jgi:hypothetical protein